MTEQKHRFVETKRYLIEADAIGFGRKERGAFETKIRLNPRKGTEIPNGIFKVRDRHRGGVRIIHALTIAVDESELVTYLLSIYAKSDKEDLTNDEYREIRQRMARAIERMKDRSNDKE